MAGSGRKNCDEAILLALASGLNVAQTARQAQVAESTVRRRLQDVAFRTRVAEAKSEMVSAAVGRLAGLGVTAADALEALLASSVERVVLGAARAVLEHMFRGHELLTLAQRVEALERQLQQRGSP